MAQNGFPGLGSGMFSQAFQNGVHPLLNSMQGSNFGGQFGGQQPMSPSGFGGMAASGLGSQWMGMQQPQQQAAPKPPGWGGNSAIGGDYNGQVNSNDPWSWLTQDQSGTAAGQFHRMLGGAGKAGVFDPMGSTPLVNMLQQLYQSQFAGQQRGAMEQARNNMVDPSGYGYASLLSQLGGQSGMADALGQARLQSAMQNQNWLRGALGGGFMGQLGGYLSGEQNLSAQEKLMADQQNAQKHAGMGGMLGSLLGAGLGAATGNPGAAMGLFGGGGQQQQQQFNPNQMAQYMAPFGMGAY